MRRTVHPVWLGLTVAYFAVVAAGIAGDTLSQGADAVADGRVWLLVTSALRAEPPDVLLQTAIAAAAAALFIVCLDARAWWIVAVAGHVLSAVGAYLLIGVAVLLGSSGARDAAADPDFGISCVMAATFGGLLVVGARAHRRLPLAVGAAGSVAMLAISLGWYDIEHLLAVLVGVAATCAMMCNVDIVTTRRGES